MIMILKQSSGSLHGFLISAEGKEQRIPQYAIILQDMVQNTKGMAGVNFMVGAALGQGQKKEKLLLGEHL